MSSPSGQLSAPGSDSKRPRVAAIIPAYNEAARVVDVLETISRAHGVDEILVVTDGCTDNTASNIRAWLQNRAADAKPVQLFELEHNIGKGGAMAHGAHRASAEILLFLDADLIGLQPSQVDEMIAPMLREKKPADMVLGLFGAVRGGLLGWWLSYCHRAVPSITGQRAIRREVFLAIPGLTRSRFGVEAAITCFVQSDPDLKVEYAYLHAVTHPIKEEKLGPWRGARNRARMYREIARTVITHRVRQEAIKKREKALDRTERFGNK
ncbi:Glycosyltransferase involved in cell wall bisynthesis [Abditibacterium utsteinense]|uniref:Glycosyltransferase involved in cell wall bisynthesis n=1 Tax=Abditibacterium utsteinense TaxID=1960156 RepID=A0A2S8SRC1_9BACT|nr:glycosyltransferase family 2 protein [Abditibacterium utsteinense]PQV63354.1 Glycosyltransferase involved in cell wall bisynthesis [Abditibacterium utsteinense]